MTHSNDVPGEMHDPTDDHDYQPGTEPGLDAMFADLSRAAHSGTSVEPSDALQSFVSIGQVDISDATAGGAVHDLGDVPMGVGAAPETSRRTPLLSTFTALFASATGKLVLTGGIAAASVAGAHSTGVVDVPLLPDVNEAAVVLVQDDESDDVELDAEIGESTVAEEADAADGDDALEADETTADDSDDDSDSDDTDLDATITVTVNGEDIEITDEELDAFLEDFEANVGANTEAWEAAVATCEAAVSTLEFPIGDATTVDPSTIDTFMAEVDAALQTCFDAIDEAGLAGPLSGLDLSEIEDFDLDLDLNDLGDFEFDFDLDDLGDDFPFDLDELDGFPIDPDAFGDLDLEDLLGDLPFDPADPNAFDQWLADQGIDLTDLENLENLEDLEDFDGIIGDFPFDDLDLDDLDLGQFDGLIEELLGDWDWDLDESNDNSDDSDADTEDDESDDADEDDTDDSTDDTDTDEDDDASEDDDSDA